MSWEHAKIFLGKQRLNLHLLSLPSRPSRTKWSTFQKPLYFAHLRWKSSRHTSTQARTSTTKPNQESLLHQIEGPLQWMQRTRSLRQGRSKVHAHIVEDGGGLLEKFHHATLTASGFLDETPDSQLYPRWAGGERNYHELYRRLILPWKAHYRELILLFWLYWAQIVR